MKTLIQKLAFFATLLVCLSGCIDLDLGDMDFSGGLGSGYYYDDGSYYTPYNATFYIDSVTQESDSKVKVWGQIRYDSILTIENRSISYYENENWNTRIIQSQAETIDFKTLPDSVLIWTGRYEHIYKYSIEIDSLKKDFDYVAYFLTNYTEHQESRTSQQYLTFRLY